MGGESRIANLLFHLHGDFARYGCGQGILGPPQAQRDCDNGPQQGHGRSTAHPAGTADTFAGSGQAFILGKDRMLHKFLVGGEERPSFTV